ncbi:MAG: tripartite tricarboxylate transporter substrate binding protein [Bdellovibrionales bacterium]|nr:tripartite tricarboxylate transporter substrate binding protein [Ramlibacter sp.]
MKFPVTNKARRTVLGLAALVLIANAPAFAQDSYPDKPIRIVVGFPPGGTNDILARTLSIKLGEKFKQSFVVDNKPGANSAIGNDIVAKAKPDGYTLLVSSSGGLTVNPVLMTNLAYDPVKDYEPIALLGSFPLVVTINPALPVTTLAGLVEYAKKNKGGSLDHGVATSSFQLVAESLANTAGIKFNHINYRGSGPTVIALIGGEIEVAVLDSAAVMTQVKAGKLRALAVTTAKRSAALPDLPTAAESGLPGYDVPIWTALMAPKGTPEPVLAKLRNAVREILAEKDTVDKLQALGMDPGNTDGPALMKRISADISRWAAVAKTANIKAE